MGVKCNTTTIKRIQADTTVVSFKYTVTINIYNKRGRVQMDGEGSGVLQMVVNCNIRL